MQTWNGRQCGSPNSSVINTIYSNAIGIASNASWYGTTARIANNLVYDQGTIGISTGGNGVTVANNTLYQNGGLGIQVIASQTVIENNIISQSTGRAIRVDLSSQFGVRSDYNAFELTGDAQLADWLGWTFQRSNNGDSKRAKIPIVCLSIRLGDPNGQTTFWVGTTESTTAMMTVFRLAAIVQRSMRGIQDRCIS